MLLPTVLKKSNINNAIKSTRIHSNRMHTARLGSHYQMSVLSDTLPNPTIGGRTPFPLEADPLPPG